MVYLTLFGGLGGSNWLGRVLPSFGLLGGLSGTNWLGGVGPSLSLLGGL